MKFAIKGTFLRPIIQLRKSIFTVMKKTQYHVLGIMSGTSLDGIDVALVKFTHSQSWRYEIGAAETVPYTGEWKRKLSEAVGYSAPQLSRLNQDYTRYLGEVILEFTGRHGIHDLDAVCSHGHTVKHEPSKGYTLQIGNLPELADKIGHTLVCDFRVDDVRLGGQGAPLVPVGDELLFSDHEYCLNLGGFANVSTRMNGVRVAYDICPVNTVMNYLAEKLDLPYDPNGEIAASGSLDKDLLAQFNALGFYTENPPKSLGIEWVNEQVLPLLSAQKDIPSAMHSFGVHAAIQIARHVGENRDSRVLVTGGGAYNGFLIDQIRSRTRNSIVIPSPEVVDYKEALIFGFLGVLKLRNEVNVLSSVTGASRDHSSGRVYIPD